MKQWLEPKGYDVQLQAVGGSETRFNLLATSPDRLDQGTGTPGSAAGDGVLSPEQLADTVIECMSEERFLVLPHPEVQTYRARKANDVDRWIKGMQRFESQLFAQSDLRPADWLLS